MRCGIPNAYSLDITMYRMHVSLYSYHTIRIIISETFTGSYEGGYKCVFEICCYRTLDTVTYIYIYIYCCLYTYFVISRLQPGHYSRLPTPNLQHTANQERNDQCGNQHHSRELLMMGIVVPETC